MAAPGLAHNEVPGLIADRELVSSRADDHETEPEIAWRIELDAPKAVVFDFHLKSSDDNLVDPGVLEQAG
jgi:hypothetical protein